MELIDKANVISDLYTEFEDKMPTAMQDVFAFYSLGTYYSFGLAFGDITSLSAEGEGRIEETWSALLAAYDLDDIDYDLAGFIMTAGLITDDFIFSHYNVILD